MSGGVDSAVVAHLLSQRYPLEHLVGIHMSNWDFHDEHGGKNSSTTMTGCWEQDWKDARSVADHLNIPIRHVSFQAEYWNDVFAPYCQQVEQSITPNPDVDCNRHIKFGVLKKYLWDRFAIQRLATGHYARLWDRQQTATTTTATSKMPDFLEEALEETELIVVDYLLGKNNGGELSPAPILMAAQDRTKDQSYFLSGVPALAFSDVLFPLGDFYKSTPSVVDQNNNHSDILSVRAMALDAQLPNATKRDSMGICFVGKRKHGEFINDYIAPSSSSLSSSSEGSELQCINVEDQSVVATFDPASNPALAYATVGQGAKISGLSQRWFVVERQQGNILVVCPGTHHPALYASCLFLQAQDMNWLCGGGRPPPFPFRAKCRIRHLQPLVDCEIRQGRNLGEIAVHLDVPLRGIAPGQVCTFYAAGKDGDLVCLGGGSIHGRGKTYWERQQDLPPIVHPAGQNDLSYAQG